MACTVFGACNDAQPPSATSAPLSSNGNLGTLERRPLVLEPPAANVEGLSICEAWHTRWHFTGRRAEGLVQLLETAGLSVEDRASIADSARCDDTACEVSPDTEWVAHLSQRARTVLYGVQLGDPGDAHRLRIISHPKDDPDLWQNDRLESSTREAIEDLSIEHAGRIVLPDPETLCVRVPDPEQRKLAFATLTRTRAYSAQLDLDRGTDLADVVRYFSDGSDDANVRSTFGRLPESHGRRNIDLTYLLPEMARARVMKFPAPGAPPLDCHWTTLNFDNPDPVEIPLTWPEIKRTFDSLYEPVPAAKLAYGDVVLFTTRFDGGEHYVHSVVYVGGGVVFGRNGMSPLMPWALLRLDDELALYKHITTDVVYLRKKR